MVNDRDESSEIQAVVTTATIIAPPKDMIIQRRLQQPQPPRTSLPMLRSNNSLQRNPSVTSTHSTHSNSNNSNNIIATTTKTTNFPTTTSPASPASPAASLSALSKNSSNISCSGSSMASGRMSVDDILSISKFGRRKKRRRIHQKIHTATTNDNGVIKKLVKNKPVYHHHQHNHYNPGQEDRKKRMERMQQEQLQRHRLRRLPGAGTHRSQKLVNLTKLEKMIEEEMLEKERARDNEESSRGTTTTSSSSSNRKYDIETPQRRSERAKTGMIASYDSVSDLAKNRKSDTLSEITTTAAIRSTLPRTTTTPKRKTPSSEVVEITGRRKSADAVVTAPPPEVMEEPECALSALKVLLSKYQSWADGTASSSSSSSSSSLGGDNNKATTPWNVVQRFISVLGFLKLHDPDWYGGEECREVQTGLAGVLTSVDGVKRNVMNRNNGDTTSGDTVLLEDDGGEGEDGRSAVERREAKLLQMIQIQVWVRMMVWSLEQDVGWEFFSRVVASAEARDAELPSKNGASSSSVDVDDAKSKGKKSKKNKKSKSKGNDNNNSAKKKKQSIIIAPPRESLVRDVRTLTELAPYVLPPSSDFARWLKSTLTFGYRQTVPEYGAELFDHFEIDAVVEPVMLKRNASGASRRSERSEVSRSPAKKGGEGNAGAMSGSSTKRLMERRNERQRAYFASLAEESKAPGDNDDDDNDDDESATITGSTITGSLSTMTSVSRSSSVREKDDADLFKTSVSLVSSHTASQNPFLKGSARGNYVGNHFNAKLSNITSLFREVKAPPKPKPVLAAEKRGNDPELQRSQSLPEKHSAPANQPRWRPTTTKKAPPKPKPVLAAEKRGKDPALQRSKSLPEKHSAPANQPRRRPTMAKTRLLASTPPNGTPPKRPRSPTATSSFRKAAAPLFQVDETPLRPIIDETPTPKQPRQRSFINARDDDDYSFNAVGIRSLAGSIVVETPVWREPSPRGAVRPTNLWGAPDPSRRSPRKKPSARRGRNDDVTADSITPVCRHPRRASTTSPSSFSVSSSPMPHRTDLGSVMARAAKAYNARKKK